MGNDVRDRTGLRIGTMGGVMTTQSFIAIYLIFGFIIAGIANICSEKIPEKDMNNAILGTYMILLVWPFMLPVFMVLGIAHLKTKGKS